jgi:hypothetical protein
MPSCLYSSPELQGANGVGPADTYTRAALAPFSWPSELRHYVDTFHFFDIFNFDIFDFVAFSLENSATYDLVRLARLLPLPQV